MPQNTQLRICYSCCAVSRRARLPAKRSSEVVPRPSVDRRQRLDSRRTELVDRYLSHERGREPVPWDLEGEQNILRQTGEFVRKCSSGHKVVAQTRRKLPNSGPRLEERAKPLFELLISARHYP